jgi:hypothetical protein
LADETKDAEGLREVLKQARKLYMEPADIYIPPRDRNTWKRFRNCTSAFYEAVTDPINTVKSNAELLT